MRVLIVGGYGLIGGQVLAAFAAAGHEVVGAGRDVTSARRRFPFARWEIADLARFGEADWAPLLAGVDIVINCAGALQDGPLDNLTAVHVTGLSALARASMASGVTRLVHISAAGVSERAGAFGRTKLAGEQALAAQAIDWLILRPGLVLGPAAFGGSALLRGLSGFPLVIPCAYPGSLIQVVGVEDVARAALAAIEPDAPRRAVTDLVSAESYQLRHILLRLRSWLGLPSARVARIPNAIAAGVAAAADALAWLGWRSPMRSTALAQLRDGVRGDASSVDSLRSMKVRNLDQLLAAVPSGVQERWFARLYFLKPLGLVTLAAFWAASGICGLLALDRAAALLQPAAFSPDLAHLTATAGSAVDLALALMVCCRQTALLALRAMIAVSASYLAAATLLRPDLWGDPLGPLVKVVPAMILALILLALMEER